MKRTKEDLMFIKKVGEDNLAGAYDPHKLTTAVTLINGQTAPMHISHKKQVLMGFFNYTLNNELNAIIAAELTVELSTDKTELAVNPLSPDLDCTHTEDNTEVKLCTSGDTQTVKVTVSGVDTSGTKVGEEIVLTKPKAKRKKRVTRKKITKSNLNLEA